MVNPRYFILTCILTMTFYGCQTTSSLDNNQVVDETADNLYDSEFPDKTVSNALDFVSETVKKLDCLVFYETHVFPDNNTLDINKLSDSLILANSIARSITNESVTGTAAVIYYDGIRVGLLTCAHVIDFVDTLVTRYDGGTGPIETLSIKIRQQNYVKDLPEGDDIEVLILDSDKDIAILGKKLDDHTLRPRVLNYPVGNTKDLEWGSIVYVMGYPLGHLMVTRAIVSNPDRANKGRFLTDALYNRGISGSPVLSIRDGAPNFEWVGMATSAAAQRIYFLKPGKTDPEYINPEEEYTDELYVDHYRSINYGVTYNISIEAITSLLRKNSNFLYEEGYILKMFFK